jgi:hypothetical protein
MLGRVVMSWAPARQQYKKTPLAGVCAILLGFLVTGCIGPTPRRGGAKIDVGPPPAPAGDVVPESGLPSVPVPVEPVVEIPAVMKSRAVALWAPALGTDALGAARYLAERPWVRVTALFPEHFFGEDEKSKQAKALFQTLVSSAQVEVVLTLPEEPVLPLIMDTANARASYPSVTSFPSAYAWPDDAVEQISLAREAYRRRWRVPPTGMAMPWGVALGPEFPLLAPFKIGWALVPSSGPAPALVEGFKIPVIRAGSFPLSPAARKEWFNSRVQSVLVSSGTVGPIQFSGVDQTAAFELLAGGTGTVRWSLLSEVVAEGLPYVGREPAPRVDFTPWIGDEEENRAWDLLGHVRRSVEDYQNSGSANLRSLDLAKRSLYSAQNGAFFDRFGAEKDGGHSDDVLRNFLATLAQVYQIMGQPVPPELRQGSAFKSGVTPGKNSLNGSSFERDGTVFRWRDTLHDDRGPGDYFYPTGPQFPPGAWDILGFEVRPTDDDVTLVFDFAALSNNGRAPSGFSLPLVDVYIDINHSPGAGSQSFLPGRPGIAEAADAWEYAVSVDGWGARFYSSVLGKGDQAAATFSVIKTSDTAFAVTIPRRYFRGDPDSWGFAVLVMGRSSTAGIPMPVEVNPGPDHFGGAVAGREAPPYIDMLTPEGTSQRRVLGVYKSGQDITIPFVRSE